jgi:O-antigen/teichoic acid export membrane protein
VTLARFRSVTMDFLRNPGLHRDSLFLMASTALGAIGGFVYWKVLTLRFSAVTVGLASASITSATFWGSFATLGLPVGLVRFMPVLRSEKRSSLVQFSYLASVVAGMGFGLVFLLGRRWWAPALIPADSEGLYLPAFLALTVFLSMLAVNSGLLQAQRRTPLLLVRTVSFSLIQISCALATPISWGIAGVLFTSLLPNGIVALGMFAASRSFLKTHQVDSSSRGDESSLAAIVRYSLGNQIFNLVWGLPAFLFPLIVLHRLGPELNASLTLAWYFYSFLAIIPNSTSVALLVDGSHAPAGLGRQMIAAMRTNFLLLLPVILTISLLAPWLLGFFGPAYTRGINLLRLLAISSLPISVNSLYMTVHRVRKQLVRLNMLVIALTLVAIALAYIFVSPLGLDGLGWGWLIGQIGFLLGILPFIWKEWRLAREVVQA